VEEELRNKVEEERNKWQGITNELREDCNMQVQNIRRGKGERGA
jgi:hypothetical protein